MVRKTTWTLAAALVAATLATAGAQTLRDRAVGGMSGMMGGGMGPMMGCGPAMAQAGDIEARIASLKTELAITDAQSARWTAFADAWREQAEGMRSAMGGMMGLMMNTDASVSAPDRADAMLAMMSARLDGMKAVVAAEKALYAELTDAQKTIADRVLGVPMMGMGGRSM